jgi:hypothetical protein
MIPRSKPSLAILELRLAALTFFAVLCASFSRVARADETIDDPELAPKGAAAKPAPAPAPAEQTIDDPELTGNHAATPPAEHVDAGPRETTWRMSLHTRFGVDPNWVTPSQDVLEGTTIASIEAEQRRSDSLMFSVGLRARHAYAMQRGGAMRYDFDVTPVSAFIDVTPADGYHMRAGYQSVTQGRFDIFSAANFLAVYDLRSGPVTMPEGASVAQPALRFDFDRIPGLTVSAYYLPFFQPDLVSAYGTNYSPPIDRVLDEANLGKDDPRPLLAAFLDRSQQGRLANGFLSAFGPNPSLAQPQGSVRATWHGSAGELSATVGSALERLPVITFSNTFLQALGYTNSSNLLSGGSFGVAYERFEVVSVDGATDLGPLQIGAELAYMANRSFYAAGQFNPPTTPPAPILISDPQRANVVHAGLRAEHVEASGWAVEVEAFTEAVLGHPANITLPATATPQPTPQLVWQNLDGGHYFSGVAGGVEWAPDTVPLRIEIGGMFFTGPSYVLVPRVEWHAFTPIFFELGGAVVAGPAPPIGTSASQMTSLGGLYSDVDQVFVGVRWVP